jgi:hypothetical protein
MLGSKVTGPLEWGTTSGVPDPTHASSLSTTIFQDAFQMGQAIERQLVLLDTASAPVGGSDPGDPESVARGGVAEQRSWAGAAVVHAWGDTASQSMAVRIAGYDYSNLGLAAGLSQQTRQQAIADAFGFVYGPPWMAECAAHVRSDCGENFDATYV